MIEVPLTIGVDLGGTKIETALVDNQGKILARERRPTPVAKGPAGVRDEILTAIRTLLNRQGTKASAVGVGVAGQVDRESGTVVFAPNLRWENVPLRDDLAKGLELPVVVANDVRAATWGEWLDGAGRDCEDLVCLFAGTGIGGGVVSGGRMLSGHNNTAGEIGHMTVDLNGPPCTCGNRGCFEALAGGWAIARRAESAVAKDPAAGARLLELADQRPTSITAEIVTKAFRLGDPLAAGIVEETAQALIAGCVGLVNAFNPERLILGGGVVQGLPELTDWIGRGIRSRALKAATSGLQVLPSKLQGDAGVIGAAALSQRIFADNKEP
jgi:glucokinase